MSEPADAVRLNGLGMRALEAGDPAAARGFFEQATALDPSAAALWMNLAKAQRLLGDDTGEGASLDSALASDQRHFMALVRRAELHERLGQVAKATARWNAVLALAPALDNGASGGLDAVLNHARDHVARSGRAFAAAIEPAFDGARDGLDAGERRRFDAALDAILGRRRIYANECAGLHIPFLPADEFFERRHFPWLAAFEARTDAIRAEYIALAETGTSGFTPYVDLEAGTPPSKWSSLDRSPDWNAFYLWKMGERINEACDRCPDTAAALEDVPTAQLPGRAPTAFFSVLAPGARIPPHCGVSNTRAVVHLPLVVPNGCGFRVGGETRRWKTGEAFVFDDTIEHEAWNKSTEPRAVLIVDVWNPYLSDTERALVNAFYVAADASGLNPDAVANA